MVQLVGGAASRGAAQLVGGAVSRGAVSRGAASRWYS